MLISQWAISSPPNPIIHEYVSKIDDFSFDILSYSKETILAEKIETLISKGHNNSRIKDFFDIYLLVNEEFDNFIFNAAVVNTFHNRNTQLKKDIIYITKKVLESERFKLLFENYRKKHSFVKNVSLKDCCNCILKLVESIEFNECVINNNIELTIVRHGQDERDKLGGWSDNHLTEIGASEVECLCDQLDSYYDVILSSDLVRAIETANIIKKRIDVPVVYCEGLRETNNGLLKNLTKEEFNIKYPGLYWSSLRMDERYPDGESPNEFYNRVKETFVKILENYKGKKVLIVTHGGVITVIKCLINGWKYSNLLKITPPTGSIIKFN